MKGLFLRWRILPLVLVCGMVQAALVHADQGQRFIYCKDQAGLLCEYPGTGFTVCEAYLKSLNTLPEKWKHGACVPWIDPSDKRFGFPNWEHLDVNKNLSLMYQIERLIPPSNNKIEDFDEWRSVYMLKIQTGKIKPSLMRATMEITKGAGSETLLRYDEGDAGISGCDKGVPNNGGGSSAWLFILDEAKSGLIGEVNGIHTRADVVVFSGKPLFVRQNKYGEDWYIAVHVPESVYKNNKRYYFSPMRCEFINKNYGGGSSND